jgi:hypothetical protein
MLFCIYKISGLFISQHLNNFNIYFNWLKKLVRVLVKSGVKYVVTDISDMVASQDLGDNQKVILLIETEGQKRSLLHPIRKRILKVLSIGIDDYQTKTETTVENLEDGTDLVHHVHVKKPIRRYWMTVPEIVDALKQRNSKQKVTVYQCYYHLDKLCEQGLVEQDPHSIINEKKNKKRIRGKRFRSAARYFLSNHPTIFSDNTNQILNLLEEQLGLNPSNEDGKQLIDLVMDQDKALFNTLEYLASHLNHSDSDCVTLPVLLERLAHVYLSNDEEFIERYRDVKEILIRSGGKFLETDEVVNPPVQKGDVK